MKAELGSQILIIGQGRLARHLGHYLNLLKIPYRQWWRELGAVRLDPLLTQCTHIWLAVSDGSIEDLAKGLQNDTHTLVHFAAAHDSQFAFGAHPLMTFGDSVYNLEVYQSMPFVLDQPVKLASLLPGLKNRAIFLPKPQRRRYHALCALTNNLPYLLWVELKEIFSSEFEIQADALKPILSQTVENALSPMGQLSGPVARGDWIRVREHLQILITEPALQSHYQAYLQLARKRGWKVPEELL